MSGPYRIAGYPPHRAPFCIVRGTSAAPIATVWSTCADADFIVNAFNKAVAEFDRSVGLGAEHVTERAHDRFADDGNPHHGAE